MAKREKATVNLTDRPEFPSTHEGMLITSKELCKHVNALMSRIFADYSGCKVFVDQGSTGIDGTPIQVNPNHPVQLELYFNLGNHDDSSAIYAFDPIVDAVKGPNKTGKKSFLSQALGYNIAITHNRTTEISQNGIDIIGDLLWYEVAGKLSNNPNAKEFNNKGIVIEASTATVNSPYMVNGQKAVYNIVRYVDINVILSKLFDDNDKHFVYSVQPIKPIITMAPNGYLVANSASNQKWLFNVNRINYDTFLDVCNETGEFNTGGTLNIVTESY